MTSETVETRGDYRVRIVLDETPEPPDWDGQGIIIQATRPSYRWSTTLRACDGGTRPHVFDRDKIVRKPQTEEGWLSLERDYLALESWRREAVAIGSAVESALQHADDKGLDEWAFVERYLRAYHDVVSFDRIDWDTDTLICVITRSLQERWGCADEYIKGQAAVALKYWEMYGQGDVWLVDVQKRETWRKDGTDDTRDEWESVEPPRGDFYGQADAEEAAKERLAEYLPA